MANAISFLIAANDEHGLNPPTPGKRTPILPYINRSFYENEFANRAKNRFIEACLRVGYNVLDVKPEQYDVSVSTRVARVNAARASLLLTMAYDAYGSGNTFNNLSGYNIFYSNQSRQPSRSRTLSQDIFQSMQNNGFVPGRNVATLTGVGVLQSVNCPSTLLEAGYMTNFEEAKFMVNPIYHIEVGERCCQGVCEFLNVPYIARNNLSAYPLLVRGQRGNKVRLLQYLLNRYRSELTTDGIFGANTLSAVVKFQGNNNLRVDGIVGPATWSALLDLNPSASLLRLGSSQSSVLFLQELLLSYLYPVGTLDGIFGAVTQREVMAFQNEHGLVVDGIVGPATWAALLSIKGRPMP